MCSGVYLIIRLRSSPATTDLSDSSGIALRRAGARARGGAVSSARGAARGSARTKGRGAPWNPQQIWDGFSTVHGPTIAIIIFFEVIGAGRRAAGAGRAAARERAGARRRGRGSTGSGAIRAKR